MSRGIVLATRFGPSSAAPAAVAADLAHRFSARVTVVYIAAELEAIGASGGEAGVDPHAERERTLTRINEELHSFIAKHLRDEEVAVQVIEGGDVAEIVTRVARETDARYLVVGTRGRGQLARLILGDTTQSILQRTPCPVVVVPLRDADGESV